MSQEISRQVNFSVEGRWKQYRPHSVLLKSIGYNILRKQNSGDYLKNEVFWSEIRSYIDNKKIEIESQRKNSRPQQDLKRICPSCGSKMVIENMYGVIIDLCNKCGGIFLDRGELDLLFQTKQKSGFIPTLKRFFSDRESP